MKKKPQLATLPARMQGRKHKPYHHTSRESTARGKGTETKKLMQTNLNCVVMGIHTYSTDYPVSIAVAVLKSNICCILIRLLKN